MADGTTETRNSDEGHLRPVKETIAVRLTEGTVRKFEMRQRPCLLVKIVFARGWGHHLRRGGAPVYTPSLVLGESLGARGGGQGPRRWRLIYVVI